jgi:hypothetical protein
MVQAPSTLMLALVVWKLSLVGPFSIKSEIIELISPILCCVVVVL